MDALRTTPLQLVAKDGLVTAKIVKEAAADYQPQKTPASRGRRISGIRMRLWLNAGASIIPPLSPL